MSVNFSIFLYHHWGWHFLFSILSCQQQNVSYYFHPPEPIHVERMLRVLKKINNILENPFDFKNEKKHDRKLTLTGLVATQWD